MTSITRLILPLIVCMTLVLPEDAPAQDRSSFDSRTRGSLLDRSVKIPDSRTFQPRSESKAVLIGALVGAGAALALTAAAASEYGNNEGGEFCSRCMVQWSAVTVPVGAAIGAGIGFGVKRARRSVTATPIVTRRAAGVMVFARF